MLAKYRWMVGWIIVGLVAVTWWGCSPLEDNSGAPNKLTVVTITGRNAAGEDADWLASDVATVVQVGEQQVVTVFEDTVNVTLQNTWLAIGIQPTTLNDLVVNRYRVTYIRSDGHNQPGVDVPFPFTDSTNIYVPVNDQAEGQIVVVRAAAKLEEPLYSLRSGFAEGELAVTAEIQFWAQDLIGNVVTTKAFFPIHFADWADQQ